MAIRRNEVPEGAHWLSLLIGALLSILLGVLLACVTRAITPPEKVRELPERPEPGVVYYVKPSRPGILPPGWRHRWDKLVAGQPGIYVFTKEEVVLVAESAFEVKEGPPEGPVVVVPGSLQATLTAEGAWVSTEGSLRVFGIEFPLIVQAVVGFAADGETVAAVPRRLHFNSLEAPAVFGLRARLFEFLRRGYTLSESTQTALARVSSVTVGENSISIEVPR